VFTAYKISGYRSSSGKKKAVDVLINIRILKFWQTPDLYKKHKKREITLKR